LDHLASIRQTFFLECEEQLAELESGLVRMNEGIANSETVNAVFRAVHSIKGGAGAFKFDDLVSFAHTYETTLDRIRTGQLTPRPEVMKTVLRAADVLADLVTAARVGDRLDETIWLPVLADCRDLSDGSGLESAKGETHSAEAHDFRPVRATFDMTDLHLPSARPMRTFTIYFKPKRELYANANESVLLLRELARL
jgi:two-component system, chemotaxis family, sensor kinase CheA